MGGWIPPFLHFSTLWKGSGFFLMFGWVGGKSGRIQRKFGGIYYFYHYTFDQYGWVQPTARRKVFNEKQGEKLFPYSRPPTFG